MKNGRDGSGSPLLTWLKTMVDIYEPFGRYTVEKFRRIPDFEGSGLIGDDDVDDLVELCNTFDVDIPGVIEEIRKGSGNLAYISLPDDVSDDRLLYDKRVFVAVKGRVGKKINRIMNETLKPEHWER